MKKIIGSVLLLVMPALATATDSPWWKFWSDSRQETGSTTANTSTQSSAGRLFTETERQRLREFLRTRQHSVYDQDADDEGADDDDDHKKNKHNGKGGKGKQKPLPPGLQKKVARGGQLPPGWQKKLARGEVIDGDLYSQSEPLPYDWARRLHDPEGTETRVIGDKVFRVMRNTREILDILGQ